MTKPPEDAAVPPNGGLFEDLPEPTRVQLQQAHAEAEKKRRQGSPRLLEADRA